MEILKKEFSMYTGLKNMGSYFLSQNLDILFLDKEFPITWSHMKERIWISTISLIKNKKNRRDNSVHIPSAIVDNG